MCLPWAGCVGLGAEELLGFGSCQSQVLTAVCPLHVLLSCPSLWAGAVGWAVFQDRDSLLQPHAGPAELSPVHCCPWKQGGAFSARLSRATRRSGAVETPLSAEPIYVSSGSLFLAPSFGDVAPCCSPSAPYPALLLPCLGASTPKQPWDTLACPMSHCLQGTVLFLPRLWERQSSVLPSWGGKVCSCFCLFPMFIPRLSSPLAAAMECPWSSHIRCQIWLLPLACSSTGSPCFPCSPAFPQQLLPWKSQGVLPCAGVLLVELLGSTPSPGTGAGRNPASPWHLHHFPFLSPGKLLGWGCGGIACIRGCPWESGTISSHAVGVRASPGPVLPSPPQAPEVWLGCTERL